jgi:hypothetical protein
VQFYEYTDIMSNIDAWFEAMHAHGGIHYGGYNSVIHYTFGTSFAQMDWNNKHCRLYDGVCLTHQGLPKTWLYVRYADHSAAGCSHHEF